MESDDYSQNFSDKKHLKIKQEQKFFQLKKILQG